MALNMETVFFIFFLESQPVSIFLFLLHLFYIVNVTSSFPLLTRQKSVLVIYFVMALANASKTVMKVKGILRAMSKSMMELFAKIVNGF